MQALREGREIEALRYVKEAQAIRPNAPWVLDLLYQLELRSGNALDGAEAVRTARLNGLVPADGASARLAPLYTHGAKTALLAEDMQEALDLSAKALEQDQGFLPAVLIRARALLAAGRVGQAKSVLTQAWKRGAHPDASELYLGTLDETKPAKARRQSVAFLSGGKDKAAKTALGEYLLLQLDLPAARAALEQARDDGSARATAILQHVPAIEAALAEGDGAREEFEQEARDKALNLFQVALMEPQDSAWLCAACGSEADEWHLKCEACGENGTIEWQDINDRRIVKPVRGLIERPGMDSL